MKLPVIETTSKQGSQTVSDAVFAAPVNQDLLAQAIRVYQSNLRQGTAQTKTRSAVQRTKAKWYRQKGTGNARHGSKNAPIFVGGGVAHGPQGNANWVRSLTPVLKKKALISALSAQAENLLINTEIESLKGKTKAAATVITAVAGEKNRVLVVITESKPEVLRSLRNLPNVLVTQASRLTALEVAMADKIVLTKAAVEALETRLVSSKDEKVSKAATKKTAKTEKVTQAAKK